jgi:hypothetical protein
MFYWWNKSPRGFESLRRSRSLRAATWLGVDLQAERKLKASLSNSPDPVKTINAVGRSWVAYSCLKASR